MKEIADQTVSLRRLGEKHTKVEQLTEIIKQLKEEAKSPDKLAVN